MRPQSITVKADMLTRAGILHRHCTSCGSVVEFRVRRFGDIEDESIVGRGEYCPRQNPNILIVQDSECSNCHMRWEAMMVAGGDCILTPMGLRRRFEVK